MSKGPIWWAERDGGMVLFWRADPYRGGIQFQIPATIASRAGLRLRDGKGKFVRLTVEAERAKEPT